MTRSRGDHSLVDDLVTPTGDHVPTVGMAIPVRDDVPTQGLPAPPRAELAATVHDGALMRDQLVTVRDDVLTRDDLPPALLGEAARVTTPVRAARVPPPPDDFLPAPTRDDLRVATAETRDDLGDHTGTRDAPHRARTTPVRPGPEARVGTRIDQYELVGVLGNGAMGTVYRARHVGLGRDYALKILEAGSTAQDTRAKRFLREARAAAQVEHPHVVRVVYSGMTTTNDAFLVMELLEGRALSAEIAEGPLSVERAASIARQLALGLEAIHARGFLHRDLKPSNVMMVGDHAKILDLGLVGAIEPDRSEARLTQQGHVMGTPAYMAPETFTNDEFVPASDLYALGIVIHEMLSGRTPFEGSIQEILWRQCFMPPPPLPPSRGLAAVAARLMAKEPQERWARARDVIDEIDRRLTRSWLRAWLEDVPPRLWAGVQRAFAADRPGRWSRWPLAAAVVMMVLAVGIAAWATRARERTRAASIGASPLVAPDPSTPAILAPDRRPERAPAPGAEASPSALPSPSAALASPAGASPSPSAALASPSPSTAAAIAAPTRASPAAAPRKTRAPAVEGPPREILVTSDPPGARVETADGILGLTPISVLVPTSRATTLTLTLAGHAPRRIRIPAGADTAPVHTTLGDAR